MDTIDHALLVLLPVLGAGFLLPFAMERVERLLAGPAPATEGAGEPD